MHPLERRRVRSPSFRFGRGGGAGGRGRRADGKVCSAAPAAAADDDEEEDEEEKGGGGTPGGRGGSGSAAATFPTLVSTPASPDRAASALPFSAADDDGGGGGVGGAGRRSTTFWSAAPASLANGVPDRATSSGRISAKEYKRGGMTFAGDSSGGSCRGRTGDETRALRSASASGGGLPLPAAPAAPLLCRAHVVVQDVDVVVVDGLVERRVEGRHKGSVVGLGRVA